MIRLETAGQRADLWLDRPEKRNALNLAMWSAIPEALVRAEEAGVRVLVVRGAGDAFAAGADIAEFATAYASAAAAAQNQRTMLAAMSALEDFPAPTVAMISCVGGGCAIALCCDLRVAAPDARFGITPAKLGLSYGVADTRRLVAAVGLSRAKDILFTGRLLDAAEAWRIGLVDRLSDSLEAETGALVAELLAASGYTARAVKQTCAELRGGASEETAASRARFAAAFDGGDFREGFDAFMSKRKPRFP
jgi:enoyl-CoA hydratase/carnithine racemase